MFLNSFLSMKVKDLFWECDEVDRKHKKFSIMLRKQCGDIKGYLHVKYEVNYYTDELHLQTKDTQLPLEGVLVLDITKDRVLVIHAKDMTKVKCEDYKELIRKVDNVVMDCDLINVDTLNRKVLDTLDKFFPVYDNLELGVKEW